MTGDSGPASTSVQSLSLHYLHLLALHTQSHHMNKHGRQHLARPAYSDSITMSVAFRKETCCFPRRRKHLLGAWHSVISFLNG